LVRADARALPFAGEFDLAVTFGALGHFLPAERPAVFAGVHRALRPGGLFAFAIGAPPPLTSIAHWVTLGFDAAMRVRNAVWRPPFVMYYRTTPLGALHDDLTAAGFTVRVDDLPGPGRCHLVVARKA
jgi:SAM-dependent methyltransferase